MKEQMVKERVKRPLNTKIILVIAILVFVMDVSFIFINYTNYMNVNENYSDSLAATVANTCRLVVDGDSVTGYLSGRHRDTEYYEVWNKLLDYCKTNENIIRISVADFTGMGARYVYDTDLTMDGAFLGDIRPYDDIQKVIKDDLMACKAIEPLNYGGRSDYYIPLNSSYNIPVAYIIVGISTENVRTEQLLYLAYITFIVTVTMVAFGVFLIRFMRRNVIKPLNAMSEAASSYSVELLRDGKETPISQMSINTGDELERLCESMKKMEYDIIFSTSQLAIADWNSNHDSMTQLYNTRHYERIRHLEAFSPPTGI